MNRPEILYQDDSILVCDKPAGVAAQTSRVSEADMVSILKNELRRQNNNKEPYLGLIHRLDQPVSGLLVFALTKKAAGILSGELSKDSFRKDYLAVVEGLPEKREGVLVDWLLKDGRTNTSKVVPEGTKDAKRAELFYQVTDARDEGFTDTVSLPEGTSLVRITLKTGRHHQIRVQMSHAGHPLLGDRKYHPEGNFSGWRNVALCAYHLEFNHPATGKRMEFTVCPPFLRGN